jgi:hypothetical protein
MSSEGDADMLATMKALLEEQRSALVAELQGIAEKVERLERADAARVAERARERERAASIAFALREDEHDAGDARSSRSAGDPNLPRGSQVPPPAPLVSDVPLSSFALDSAAASWEPHKEIKLRELPKLGRGKDEVPYGRWKFHVLAVLDAARLTPVLQVEFPENASEQVREYYRSANAVIFAGLLHSVKEISVLGDIVLRLYGDVSSARLAWLAIKAHFVRLSKNNSILLLSKLQSLEPRDGESMEAFLNRCAMLRKEFAEYDLVCDDALLTSQVLSKLSIQWKTRAGLDGPLEGVPWDVVAIALQEEDNSRRMSNTKSPEALLPLGWTRRTQGAAHAATGDSPSGQHGQPKGRDSPVSDAHAAPAAGGPPPRKGKAPAGATPQGEGKVSVPVVCWHCQKVGHLWGECKTKPAGWKPSAQDRAKAEAARDELRRRREQSLRDKEAHAARLAAQSEEPTEARVSADL